MSNAVTEPILSSGPTYADGFLQWLNSSHLDTFIQLRMDYLDENEGPASMDPAASISYVAKRNELRALRTWRPEDIKEKASQAERRILKAGEFHRTLSR